MNEINWYYVVSVDGEIGYIQITENEAVKLREEFSDNITRADPPKDLTGWRTFIVPSASFYKIVGLED